MNQSSELDISPDKLPKSVKVRSTCNACQQAKIRCSHERPACKRCQKHNISCVYSISRRLGRPAKKRDPHLESSPLAGGRSSKKTRNPKKKKVKEESMSDSGAPGRSFDDRDKPNLDSQAFDHNNMDDISLEDSSLRIPTFMEVVTAAPFSDNIDISSDSWLHEFMANPFTDPPFDRSFLDPFDSDIKVDDATTSTSMDLNSLPIQSETFSDSTSESFDLPSSSNYFATVNGCLTQNESLPTTHTMYGEQSKPENFAWPHAFPSLAGDFTTDPSSLFGQVGSSKRYHDYNFIEDDFKANSGLSSVCSCPTHEQAVRDLFRVNFCASRLGPTVAIDSILTCQRVLQQLTETILQCRVCSEIRVNVLMLVIVGIDSLLNALDAITSTENDVVERLFPDYFNPLAQDYRDDPGIASHSRRFKGNLHIRTQLDTCPLIIGGFCVPTEEKFLFVKRVLHSRLSGLLRTVHRIQLCTQEIMPATASRARLTMMREMDQKLRLIIMKLNMLSRP
ncbi:hypothetical protein BJY04DRAFT_214522 [Aspergillus karnatakaensis]|uniref:Zn(II)2Cys6 transcription factor domain-containing protein n=1 Tax=Aspergillus karnatakaensis TaxID=1810916 RepID=UPI003CCCF5ED